MLMIFLTATALAFLFQVLSGALSDMSSFRIPNRMSHALVDRCIILSTFRSSMPTMQVLADQMAAFLVTLAIALLVVIVCLIFLVRSCTGGDARYLVATSRGMRPFGVIKFMVPVSGLFALRELALKTFSNWGVLLHEGTRPAFVKRLHAKFEDNKLPFGLPGGTAPLIMIQVVFER